MGLSTAWTVASFHPSGRAGSADNVGGAGPAGSLDPVGPARLVTLVALFFPRVAAIVVAVAFPEALLVVIHEGDMGDPLRALPEVEVRY